VYLQERIRTVNNHQARLAYHLRPIIVLMWANTFLTVTTLLVIFKAHYHELILDTALIPGVTTPSRNDRVNQDHVEGFSSKREFISTCIQTIIIVLYK
jgi:hypothetical protein